MEKSDFSRLIMGIDWVIGKTLEKAQEGDLLADSFMAKLKEILDKNDKPRVEVPKVREWALEAGEYLYKIGEGMPVNYESKVPLSYH